MLNAHSFDEIAARIGKAIENSPAKDIEKNVKAMLASSFARLDLVPRAEFECRRKYCRRPAKSSRPWRRGVAEFEARLPPPAA